MSTAKTTIDGYAVEIDDTGETGVNCYITRNLSLRHYTASLACLVDTGELTDRTDRAINVHPQTIAAIVKWAEQHGY